GIIENFLQLRQQLSELGVKFRSETDTEVVAHLVRHYLEQGQDLLAAVQTAARQCEGAYALAIIHTDEPDRIVVARSGSPLLIGLGIEENFVASDPLALRQVTDRFVYLEEGDSAEISHKGYQ